MTGDCLTAKVLYYDKINCDNKKYKPKLQK